MSKNVCAHCRLGIHATEQCYAGGWSHCHGSKFKPTDQSARIAEIATMFGVCDGGQYLADWATAVKKYRDQSSRIAELEEDLACAQSNVVTRTNELFEAKEYIARLKSLLTGEVYDAMIEYCGYIQNFSWTRYRQAELKEAEALISKINEVKSLDKTDNV